MSVFGGNTGNLMLDLELTGYDNVPVISRTKTSHCSARSEPIPRQSVMLGPARGSNRIGPHFGSASRRRPDHVDRISSEQSSEPSSRSGTAARVVDSFLHVVPKSLCDLRGR